MSKAALKLVPPAELSLTDLLVAVEIEHFLTGESDGSVVLNALYGEALNEPIPERLLALVRGTDAPSSAPVLQEVCAAAAS